MLTHLPFPLVGLLGVCPKAFPFHLLGDIGTLFFSFQNSVSCPSTTRRLTRRGPCPFGRFHQMRLATVVWSTAQWGKLPVPSSTAPTGIFDPDKRAPSKEPGPAPPAFFLRDLISDEELHRRSQSHSTDLPPPWKHHRVGRYYGVVVITEKLPLRCSAAVTA